MKSKHVQKTLAIVLFDLIAGGRALPRRRGFSGGFVAETAKKC